MNSINHPEYFEWSIPEVDSFFLPIRTAMQIPVISDLSSLKRKKKWFFSSNLQSIFLIPAVLKAFQRDMTSPPTEFGEKSLVPNPLIRVTLFNWSSKPAAICASGAKLAPIRFPNASLMPSQITSSGIYSPPQIDEKVSISLHHVDSFLTNYKI